MSALLGTLNMNADRLTRQAIRLAIRKSKKAGRPLTREEILKLPVQTVETRKRVFVVCVGIGAGAIAFLCHRDGALWASGLFGLGSLFLLLGGAFGRRAYLDKELKKMTPAGVADSIVTGIINGLS